MGVDYGARHRAKKRRKSLAAEESSGGAEKRNRSRKNRVRRLCQVREGRTMTFNKQNLLQSVIKAAKSAFLALKTSLAISLHEIQTQGMCYGAPELTAEDKTWDKDSVDYNSDVAELMQDTTEAPKGAKVRRRH